MCSSDLDLPFVRGTERLADAATTAAMQTTLFVVPGADHDVVALTGGLEKGFDVLAPRLGLSAPVPEPEPESVPAP